MVEMVELSNITARNTQQIQRNKDTMKDLLGMDKFRETLTPEENGEETTKLALLEMLRKRHGLSDTVREPAAEEIVEEPILETNPEIIDRLGENPTEDITTPNDPFEKNTNSDALTQALEALKVKYGQR